MVAAVNAGANAVYIGGSRFGARAYADNLDEEAMIRAIDFVHLHNCRIYMTVNTLVKEKELPELYGYLKPYYEAGLDAVLVQDLGVFSYIREHFPDLPLHISTQMTVTGKYSAADLKRMGAVRVVPARELSLKEIREIGETTGLEVETFVHGALCYCYSGQCLFSSLIGGRSGNRGRCAQTCRLPFDVEKGDKVLGGKNEKYVLSLKDLCTLDLLPEILEAGVCSLKIEGRMKSPRYTAGVVSIYRKYVDMYLAHGRSGYRVDPADRRALLELFDRGGQSEGYYKEHNGRDMVVLKEKPAFREPDQELFNHLDRTYVDAVKKEPIRGTALVSEGKPVRLTVEYTPSLEPAETMEDGMAVLEPVSVACTGDLAETAKNAPMDGDRIRKQLMKTGDSPVFFEELEVSVEGKVFLPVQALNRLRREALEELCRAVTERFRRKSGEEHKNTEAEGAERAADGENGEEKGTGLQACLDGQKTAPEFAASVSHRDQLREALALVREKREAGAETPFGIYLAGEEFDPGQWKELADRCHKAGSACYLMLPRIFRSQAEQCFLAH
ncbi:MAG: peptidase U32 family protein, partial [Alitiscatomonas sp.]